MSSRSQAEAIRQQLIDIRRTLHKNPELGFQEFNTAELIKSKLEQMGIPFKSEIAKTGIIAEIQGKSPGKRILIRADMDALPLQESNDSEYKSQNDGVHHACGHDTHVSMLLGVAEILSKTEFQGRVILVFQPAEEGSPLGHYNVPGGAAPMIQERAIGDPNNPDYDAAIALHITTQTPVGTVSVSTGPSMGSADEYRITIKGSGGHGSAPHKAVDPVFIAAKVYSNIEGFLSRYVDPLEPYVFTIGKIEGGDRHNIISETCYMEGTLRTLNPELRKDLNKQLPEMINKSAEVFGGSADVNVTLGYPVGINDPELGKLIQTSFIDLYSEEAFLHAPAVLGAEDFFEFRIDGKRPVCMFWLGGSNSSKGFTYPNHSNFFDIDEDALPIGTATLVETALRYLKS